MVSNRLAIGVDLGGTKIAFVLIDESGVVRATHQIATGVADGPGAVIDRMAIGIRAIQTQADAPVAGIGIGSPGHINPSSGVVHAATNLVWVDVPLLDELRTRLGSDLPILLQKDTNAAVLGEMYFGVARGYQDVVLVAVGTGLGVGAVSAGQIVIGANYFATDVGHLSLNPTGRLCACGLYGCIEMYLSGNGLLAGIKEHRAQYPNSALAASDTPSTAAILTAARDGDPLANAVMAEAAQWLGIVFSYCGVLLNPALIVVGGGLGLAAADLLLVPAEQEFHRRVLPPIYEKLQIVPSQITNSAIGAACLVWHALRGA